MLRPSHHSAFLVVMDAQHLTERATKSWLDVVTGDHFTRRSQVRQSVLAWVSYPIIVTIY